MPTVHETSAHCFSKRPRLPAVPWVVALLMAFTSVGINANVIKDPATGCGVSASTHLAASEYKFQYTGTCQDGLANGQGQATWTSKADADLKTVWKGRFTQGVFQPEPLPQAPGKALKSLQVLFDLGPVKSGAGVASARLHVVSAHNMREPASACRPSMLYVTAPSEAALGQDDALRTLVSDAMTDLANRCGKQFDVSDRRSGLRVDLMTHDALALDRFGNLPNAPVRATVSTEGKALVTGYVNQVSNQARRAQADSVRQNEREATQARLAGFFKQHGAQAWMPLETISQNPFRFKDQVLVNAAKLVTVESPTTARMVPLNGATEVRVDGAAVAQWEPGSYMLVFKTMGRETVGGYQGSLQLELVAFERCASANCSDWLDLPKPIQPGDRY